MRCKTLLCYDAIKGRRPCLPTERNKSGVWIWCFFIGGRNSTDYGVESAFGMIMAVQCDYRSDSNNACVAYLIVRIRRGSALINK